jgi:hypothetical protein
MLRTAVLMVLLAGCADASKAIEKLADRACACKDAACAEQVVADLVQFAKGNPHMSGDQDKAVAAAKRLGTCVVAAGMPMDKLEAQMKIVQGVQ